MAIHFVDSAPVRPIERNPSAIKQMLLDWCKAQCAGYQVSHVISVVN